MVQAAQSGVVEALHQGSGIGRSAIKAGTIEEVQASLAELFKLYLGDSITEFMSMDFQVTKVGKNGMLIKPQLAKDNPFYNPSVHARFEEQASFFLGQVLSGHNTRLILKDDGLSHVGTNGTRSIKTEATLAQIGNGMEKMYGELLRQQAQGAAI